MKTLTFSNKYQLTMLVLALSLTFLPASNAKAGQVLGGDTRLACEALLCLASGTRPSECNKALKKYFSFSARRFYKVIKKRKSFLSLCPSSNQTTEMKSFVTAVSNGAGRCDAKSLNATLLKYHWKGNWDRRTYISNELPNYCSHFQSNAYTNLGGKTPKYVGLPDYKGYWVDANKHVEAKKSYDIWLIAEKEREEKRRQRRGRYQGYGNWSK